MKKSFFLLIVISTMMFAEDGYRLWLRYDKISNPQVLKSYQQSIKGFYFEGKSATIDVAKEELQMGLNGLLGTSVPQVNSISENGIIYATSYKNSTNRLPKGIIANIQVGEKLKKIGKEGFIILSGNTGRYNSILIIANEDIGVLYGVFAFLRMLQTNQDISKIDIASAPKIQLRLLNHWDNLDGTIERGYAGFSIWDWHRLPDYISPQYKDYARANASIGINGASLTNVNANAFILTHEYLIKVAALANVFRPYGIKVYLTARFSAPKELGGLPTADPLDSSVQQWWKNKTKEIYSLIPDFGGFLVKANSEGQPGPQEYKRTHADGANMLADAVKPFGGVVMWRAFVYDNNVPVDRIKQAYNEFKPLDGKFRDNVLIQAKNGPLDFQPREPFHQLFGATPKTNMMLELQITMEYLGQGTSLVYLAPMYKEVLESDTYSKGKGSTVAKVIDGSIYNNSISGIAGVSNVGSDRNWTGHLFGQSSWYCYGRLAWDHDLSSEQIADEWTRMTFSNDPSVVKPIKEIMMGSRETVVNYMTPLGLHHIMGWDHHYGPGPWVNNKLRADWTAVYYHRADSIGIGFDRTEKGSNAISQYFPQVAEKFRSLETCPENLLLWYHHVPWNYTMPARPSGGKSGKTFWDELCYHYYAGVESMKNMQVIWNSLEGKIDPEEFRHVQMMLTVQEKESELWRNSCVLYFQSFSRLPIPNGLEKPEKDLRYYMDLQFPYAPGIIKTVRPEIRMVK